MTRLIRTLLRANESMAFARGEQQRFISLDDPNNYGTECGTHYDHRCGYGIDTWDKDDKFQQMKMIETIQAYRGSWIRKLPPGALQIPEDVVHSIWEYYKEGPPPFIFVNKGDLLLLARYEEQVPDPEDPVVVTVTREHVILARPTDGKCLELVY